MRTRLALSPASTKTMPLSGRHFPSAAAVPPINNAKVSHLRTLGICNHSLHCVLLHSLHQQLVVYPIIALIAMLMVTFLVLATPCTKLMANGTGGLTQPSSFGSGYVPTWTPQCSTMSTSIIPTLFFFLLSVFPSLVASVSTLPLLLLCGAEAGCC